MIIVLCVLAALIVVACVYMFWYKGIGASFFTGQKKQPSSSEAPPPQDPAFVRYPEPEPEQQDHPTGQKPKDIHLSNENDDLFVLLAEDDNIGE